jgi:hypothetical protein
MLFGETVAVYCWEPYDTWIHFVGSPYLTGDTKIHCVGRINKYELAKASGTHINHDILMC